MVRVRVREISPMRRNGNGSCETGEFLARSEIERVREWKHKLISSTLQTSERRRHKDRV